MKPKLISFKICPFVQRSVITLLEKDVAFDITYIDLANKPDWFLAISPLGKVPLLQVGETVLFESAVINEYLDEVYGESLHPADPLRKAQHRAMVEFNSNMLGTQWVLSTTKDEAVFKEKEATLQAQMNRLEDQITGPWYDGEQLHLIDLAFAPLLQRQDFLARRYLPDLFAGTPKIEAWTKQLLARDSVRNSVVDDFEDLLVTRMEQGSFITTRSA